MEGIVDQLTAWFMDYGIWGLMFVSFADSSFFPIPPDVLLLPLALANRELALWYGVLTTATSVLGAILGWWIGLKAGRPLLQKFFSGSKVDKVEGYYQRYGGVALAIAGFTPIPYKIFTITAGMSKIDLRTLILWSLLGRGARFMIESVLILLFGQYASYFISEYLGVTSVVIVVSLLLLYGVYRFIKYKQTNPSKWSQTDKP